MKIKTFIIAGGNRTSLIWGCPKEIRVKIAKLLLPSVEQVGFVDFVSKKLPSLEMMGEELCVNATLALARSLTNNGQLYTSKVRNPIKFSNKNNLTTITLPLKYTRVDNTILFDGIGYYCTTTDIIPKKNKLKFLAEKYNLPAFGYAVYSENVLKPYVFVRDTNSFVCETACGSGSIAIAITLGVKKIVQLTDEIIQIEKKPGIFSVTAKVYKENENTLV